MTTNFGRITPLQGTMLRLAGYRVGRPGQHHRSTDGETVDAMYEALASLKKQTGLDHGFDLQRWHEALLADPSLKLGYTHAYGWATTLESIQEALAGDRFTRLVALA